MDEIEIPPYFICPISLQIMKDPVTTITGITYERESIEQWLLTNTNCPFTKQPLPTHSDLTPNNTLRRLIQAWCTANANSGVDRTPTLTSPLDSHRVVKLIKDLGISNLFMKSLKKLEILAAENERNRECMAGAGVGKAMLLLIIKCFKEGRINGLEEALRILHLVWSPRNEIKFLVNQNSNFIDSLIWVLHSQMENHVALKSHAILILKMAMQVANTNHLERLNLVFFQGIVKLLKEKILFPQQAIKSALHVLIVACPWGRNRLKIIEADAVFNLIELELEKPEKNITELIFNLLANLCSCADGRAQFLRHAGAIAMVTKRILRVSAATDDRAVHIFSSVARFSGTDEVVKEMLRVGGVSKLCMVMQADCAKYLKDKAREVLRLHSNVWNNSPCIAVYLLTMHTR